MGIPTIPSYQMPNISIYPTNKVSWQVDPERAVLLIHDMQNYFLNFYDTEQSPIPELIHNIAKLKEQCKKQGIPVAYTAQPGNQNAADRALLTDFWGKGLSDDPAQTGIIKDLAPDSNDLMLTKWRYSAFKKSDFLNILEKQGRDQLIICGVYAHIGCLMTAAEAFMYDIQPFLVADAVADFSYDEHKMALDYAAKRCGVTTSTDELIKVLSKGTENSNNESLTFETIHEQVACLLDIQAKDLSDTDDLFYMGLDSIGLMSLVEAWRQQGLEVSFMDLVERKTLAEWRDLMESRMVKV
ncbi:isochorismatase [Sporosarcina sp. P20a]|uniref:isochorismatase family protein n=1 Tax=Sporosarcina sp. P20a TaxID=2048256 RepID=UPI000C1711B5|nr:isochorismatase [Sporosarcina sp. P20a]PIC87313.1 isochorismatase [Sporosarcina sp. P20a]